MTVYGISIVLMKPTSGHNVQTQRKGNDMNGIKGSEIAEQTLSMVACKTAIIERYAKKLRVTHSSVTDLEYINLITKLAEEINSSITKTLEHYDS